MSADAIIEEIRVAFPARRQFPFASLVTSTQGDEPLMTAAAFADKTDWTRLEPEWLDTAPEGLGSALYFLADEPIRFFIPAYLVADLRGSLHRVNPASSLVRGFEATFQGQKVWRRKSETYDGLARIRWDPLTRGQASAIVHYLEWRLEQSSIDNERDIAEALSACWYARAAGMEPNSLPS